MAAEDPRNQVVSLTEEGDLVNLKLLFRSLATEQKFVPFRHWVGEHPNCANSNQTAVMEAASGGFLPIVMFLVKELGDEILTATDTDSGATAIHLAAELGHLDVVEYILKRRPQLLEAHCYYGETPLWRAAASGQLEMVEYLVKQRKAYVEARGGVTCRTPLLAATARGFLAVVKFLYLKGHATLSARSHPRTDSGSMAIHLAVDYQHVAIMDFLLKRRPKFLEAVDCNNCTPLWRAVHHGHYYLVADLIQRKMANADAKGIANKTMLLEACERGHFFIFTFLLSKSRVEALKQLEAKDSTPHENSCLHLAVLGGNCELIEKLLVYVPTLLDRKNRKGLTPLTFARKYAKPNVVKLLLERGAKG